MPPNTRFRMCESSSCPDLTVICKMLVPIGTVTATQEESATTTGQKMLCRSYTTRGKDVTESMTVTSAMLPASPPSLSSPVSSPRAPKELSTLRALTNTMPPPKPV
eukprot:764344-Hanusia_phi.AAC.3